MALGSWSFRGLVPKLEFRNQMRRLGLSCRKVGFVPGKSADPDKLEEQETFRTQQLEPRLAEG